MTEFQKECVRKAKEEKCKKQEKLFQKALDYFKPKFPHIFLDGIGFNLDGRLYLLMANEDLLAADKDGFRLWAPEFIGDDKYFEYSFNDEQSYGEFLIKIEADGAKKL